MRTFTELSQIIDFEDRLKYAYIGGGIGNDTFGYNRWVNQRLYVCDEWRKLRDKIILRDNGCDLGIQDRPIFKGILIHHLEPITVDDILNRADKVFDPDNLICVSHETHNYIHYGLPENRILHKERTPNDQCPWKVNKPLNGA